MTKECINKPKIIYDKCRDCDGYNTSCLDYLADFPNYASMIMMKYAKDNSIRPKPKQNPLANYCNEVENKEYII